MGIFFALVSSISWGGSDFFGGLASRRISQFQVLFLGSLSSLALLLLFAVLRGETVPSLQNILISLVAGIFGAAGLAALYRGLSIGNAALVAPVAGVIGAVVPMIVGGILEGLPGYAQMIGFFLALLGIWLVTNGNGTGKSKADGTLGLAVFAGIGFGGFLTLIAQIEGKQVFSPLVVAKLASIAVAVLLLRGRKHSFPALMSHPVVVLSGFLDAGGNMLYLAAIQYARLDIVAALSSLYPAITVLLSSVILKEEVSPKQWVGVMACIAAILLVTL